MQLISALCRQPVCLEKASSGTFEIVLVYEDLACLIGSYEFWSGLAVRFGNEKRIVTSAWNFNMLRHPDFRRFAAQYTTGADMIVLSAEDRIELPDHVRNWISTWMPGKKGQGGSLVAILDPLKLLSTSTMRTREYLRQIAGQTGMDLFCNVEQQAMKVEFALMA